MINWKDRKYINPRKRVFKNMDTNEILNFEIQDDLDNIEEESETPLNAELLNLAQQELIEQTNQNLDTFKQEIFGLIYPIGSIYMSVSDINPGGLFGGTWVSWGAGRVPVGVNSDDDDFAVVEKIGGEKKHTLVLAEIPSHNHTFTGTKHTHSFSATSGNQSAGHTHSIGAHSHGLNSHTHTYSRSNDNTNSHTLTVQQIPSHSHLTIPYITSNGGDSTATVDQHTVNWSNAKHFSNRTGGATGGGQGHTHGIGRSNQNTGQASGSTANSTAFNSGGISANHTHSVSGTTGEATQGGTVGNSGSGNAHNNLQPYITCYMWKRTA